MEAQVRVDELILLTIKRMGINDITKDKLFLFRVQFQEKLLKQK